MAGLGTRFAIERAEIGNSRPKVARACVLLDPVWPSARPVPLQSRCQPHATWEEDARRSQGLG
jgi:hypothetical protein